MLCTGGTVITFEDSEFDSFLFQYINYVMPVAGARHDIVGYANLTALKLLSIFSLSSREWWSSYFVLNVYRVLFVTEAIKHTSVIKSRR